MESRSEDLDINMQIAFLIPSVRECLSPGLGTLCVRLSRDEFEEGVEGEEPNLWHPVCDPSGIRGEKHKNEYILPPKARDHHWGHFPRD